MASSSLVLPVHHHQFHHTPPKWSPWASRHVVRRPVCRVACSSRTRDNSSKFEALLADLRALPPDGLREAALGGTPDATSTEFLFWLQDRERRAATQAEREALAALAGHLVFVKEWQDYQANRGLLPALASSLSYSNYQRYQQDEGKTVPSPAASAGVSLDDLYRLGEQQEQQALEDMQQQLSLGRQYGGLLYNPPGSGRGSSSGFGSGSRGREGEGSTLDSFAKDNRAYAALAQGAMARVRARLMGYDDEGSVAAGAVLRVLLYMTFSREERASTLPEAFTPPGLELQPGLPLLPGQAQQADGDSSGGADGSSSPGAAPMLFVTTPQDLLAAISLLEAQPAAAAAAMLPSGEDLQQVLAELTEDVREYDEKIYSRRSPLERFGATDGASGGSW